MEIASAMTRIPWYAVVALLVIIACASVHAADPPPGADDVPRCHDPRLVIEPFAGSAAYSLRHARGHDVLLNDLNE